MALTLQNNPLKISPVYNPNWIVYSSTNVLKPNFDFVFDIYKSTGSTTEASPFLRVRIPPEPTNQLGIYNPQKILQTFVRPPFNAKLTGCTAQSYIEYTYKVGEAYTNILTFTTSGLVNINGVARNVFITTQPHLFANNDNVLITQTGGTGNFNGTWEVVSALTPTTFALNLPLVIGSGNGTAVLSNNSPTTFSGLTTFSGNVAHNAAIDTIDFITYNPIDYYPRQDGSGNLYTDLPNNWKVRSKNSCVLGYITEYTNTAFTAMVSGYTGVSQIRIKTYDDMGAELGDYFIPTPCSSKITHIGVGPFNLNNTPTAVALNGNLPIIQSNVDNYIITLQNTNVTKVEIDYTTLSGSPTSVTAFKAGTYNGKNYFTWVDGITYYMWYDSGAVNWQVSNALGGGNDYLSSIDGGFKFCPTIGTYGNEWFDMSNPRFSAFSTYDCDYVDLTEPFTFEIYDFCGKWDNYEIVFMDRKGNWIPFNFELVQRKNITSTRDNFKKGLGSWDGVKSFSYKSYDRGTTNYRNTINYQYTIISNWLDSKQASFYEELFTSPDVYWNYDGNGTFVAINLTQTGEEIRNKKNSRLIQYTLQFALANNPIVQTGS